MPYTPIGYDALTLRAVVDILKDSLEVRAVLGATNAEEARARLVIGTGGVALGQQVLCADGQRRPAAPPLIELAVERIGHARASASGRYVDSGTLVMHQFLPLRTADEDAQDSYERALDQARTIRQAVIVGAVAGKLLLDELNAEVPPTLATGPIRDCWYSLAIGTWRRM